MFNNKKYTDLTTGRIVEVKNVDDGIITLDNGEKIVAKRLMDTNFYTEYIDPKNFFSSQDTLSGLANLIKNIPDEVAQRAGGENVNVNMPNTNSMGVNMNESAVILSDPEAEKQELARKYGASVDNRSAVVNQLEKFKDVLGDDIKEFGVNPNQPTTEVVINNKPSVQVSKTVVHNVLSEVDPVLTMFAKVKRPNKFEMDVKISESIPKSEFIEMWEDSYEISIIDYLADEFTNKILLNPESIRNQIREALRDIVYPKGSTPTKKVVKKPSKPKTKVLAEGENPKTTKTKSVKQ